VRAALRAHGRVVRGTRRRRRHVVRHSRPHIVAHYLLNHGTEEQKRKYLPQLANGAMIGAIAMSEPAAGSDLQGVRTRAVRDGDSYRIDGSKTFISNGYLADLIVVVAKTDPAAGSRGLSLMLVETRKVQGFRVGRILDKIGQKGQDTCDSSSTTCVRPTRCSAASRARVSRS
jgi:alkylation response protein AidB-like acyl-CoA dehydrogenase